MSGGRMSGGRLSGGLKSYDREPPRHLEEHAYCFSIVNTRAYDSVLYRDY